MMARFEISVPNLLINPTISIATIPKTSFWKWDTIDERETP